VNVIRAADVETQPADSISSAVSGALAWWTRPATHDWPVSAAPTVPARARTGMCTPLSRFLSSQGAGSSSGRGGPAPRTLTPGDWMHVSNGVRHWHDDGLTPLAVAVGGETHWDVSALEGPT
jgi:hypothetical protein